MIRGDIVASRMDKYNKTKVDSTSSVQSRLSKNEDLYEKIYTNKAFTEFTNASFDNVIDLSNISSNINTNKREQYQKSRILGDDSIVSTSEKDTLEINESEIEEIDKRERNYNINDILENARKNRKTEDEIDKKKRLKNMEYSILSDLSKEKLSEYRENKQKKLTKDEEENLEELIHTITSNSLRKKIDDELLSDLLPSEESETIISKELLNQLEEIEEKNIEIKEELEEEDKIDNSFYTRSMDLSKEDFDLEGLREDEDEEDYSFLDEKKSGFLPKLVLVLFIIAVVSIIIYVVFRFI